MLKKLLNKLEINMNNEDLLLQALTHSSFANENPPEVDNETLEFLGDAVIGLLMSSYLFEKGYKKEGELSKKRAQAVCEEALYIYANHLGLSSFLRIGKGLESTNYQENQTINADAFEAVFAAIYLDQGFKKTKELFYKLVVPYLDEVENIKDYKSALQEIVQANKKSVSYHLASESGPSHNKTFSIVVKLDEIVLGHGKAGNKKDAEQKAAKAALKKIEKEYLNG